MTFLLSHRRTWGLALGLPALLAAALPASASADAAPAGADGQAGIDKIVVVYEENHSFDKLFGGWEGVHGLTADPAAVPHHTQVGPDGKALDCLPQNDVNLTSPPLAVTCTGTAAGQPVSSAFRNRPSLIDSYIKPEDT